MYRLIDWLNFGCAGSSLLHRLSSGCREQQLLPSCAPASHGSDFSHCEAWPAGSLAVAHGLSSSGPWALERRPDTCGAWAQLLCSMRVLPDQGSNLGVLRWQPPGGPDCALFKWKQHCYVTRCFAVSPHLLFVNKTVTDLHNLLNTAFLMRIRDSS